MENNKDILGVDGIDEIIFSESFNIYNNKLIIPNILGRKFVFIFENTDPQPNQNDIATNWNTSKTEATTILSKKIRNSLGGGTDGKIVVLKTSDNKQLSFSIFAQQFSDKGYLHITINFYRQ